jgi:PPOX class probable F420-dependent enzyme
MTRVLDERQERFVAKPRIGRLATVRRDGRPHIAPVWYRYEDGAFFVLTERGSQKHRNIEHEPRVELCIDDERPPYHTVIVRGAAAVLPHPGEAWRRALAVHYLGEEAAERYIANTPAADDIMVRIEPESAAGW